MRNTLNITIKQTTTLLNRQIAECQRIAVLELAPRLNAVFWRCNSVEGHGILWGSRSLNVLIWLYQNVHIICRDCRSMLILLRELTHWPSEASKELYSSHTRNLRSSKYNIGSVVTKQRVICRLKWGHTHFQSYFLCYVFTNFNNNVLVIPFLVQLFSAKTRLENIVRITLWRTEKALTFYQSYQFTTIVPDYGIASG